MSYIIYYTANSVAYDEGIWCRRFTYENHLFMLTYCNFIYDHVIESQGDSRERKLPNARDSGNSKCKQLGIILYFFQYYALLLVKVIAFVSRNLCHVKKGWVELSSKKRWVKKIVLRMQGMDIFDKFLNHEKLM